MFLYLATQSLARGPKTSTSPVSLLVTLGLSPDVTKLQEFAAWDALVKKETWSQSSFISL